MYRFFTGKVTYIGCTVCAIGGEIMIYANPSDLTLIACGISIVGLSVAIAGFYRRTRIEGKLNRKNSSGEGSMMGIG